MTETSQTESVPDGFATLVNLIRDEQKDNQCIHLTREEAEEAAKRGAKVYRITTSAYTGYCMEKGSDPRRVVGQKDS